MASASHSMLSASTTCIIPSHTNKFLKKLHYKPNFFTIRASSSSSSPEPEDDCNAEECAPDKEVGKVSMEWLATEKTQVVGSYPPRKKGWTGYVEKDTAGQTNIYAVEPAIYVAESAISSGTGGTSSDGAENTAAIAAFIALISIAAASSVLIQVSKNKPPPVQTLEYSGPSLSYYINKFKPPETVEVNQESSAPEVSDVQVESKQESTASEVSDVQVESSNQETSSPSPGLAIVSE